MSSLVIAYVLFLLHFLLSIFPNIHTYNKQQNKTGAVFVNSTIRQTLHMFLGGSPIRIRISNAFGQTDLPISSVTVAFPSNGSAGSPAIELSTLQVVTFSGSKNYTIPNGALIVSDPIPISVAPQSNLAVSIYLEEGQLSDTNAITSHPGSRTTSWMSMGNQVSKENITDSTTESVQHWYFVSSVEVLRETSARGFVIVGDSITDGRGSDTDKNERYVIFPTFVSHLGSSWDKMG
jgi:hypothetical protein